MRTTYPRIYDVPQQSFFFLGLRGVGKSTWGREKFPDAVRIDLLDESLYQSYLANPELFAAELRSLSPRQWVLVDEVQRIPSLLNQVHRFIEEKRLRFVLLGSSARKLKTPGTNLLAGRALMRTMYPLLPEELGRDFDLSQLLAYGSLPLVQQAESKRDVLRAYVELYLKEEVKAEALVRNLAGFARFLPVAALFHGQTLNVASLARDSGTARTTIHGYLDILEDTLLTYRLHAYEGRLRVRERKHPKLYWVDAGIVRAIKKQYGPVMDEERGSLLEGCVGTLLRAYGEHKDLFDEVYYWAPAEAFQTEVDFLLKRGMEFLAVEVKAGSKIASPWFTGLKAISQLKGMTRRVVVYLGGRKLTLPERIEVWPVSAFLDALSQDKLWP